MFFDIYICQDLKNVIFDYYYQINYSQKYIKIINYLNNKHLFYFKILNNLKNICPLSNALNNSFEEFYYLNEKNYIRHKKQKSAMIIFG